MVKHWMNKSINKLIKKNRVREWKQKNYLERNGEEIVQTNGFFPLVNDYFIEPENIGFHHLDTLWLTVLILSQPNSLFLLAFWIVCQN